MGAAADTDDAGSVVGAAEVVVGAAAEVEEGTSVRH